LHAQTRDLMSIDIVTYLSGVSSTIYAVICLLCGLQLCFGIFTQHRRANTYLSNIMGCCLLILFGSAMCYMLSNLLPDAGYLYRIGASIDMFIFIGYAMMGYALYTNNESPKTKLIALASPFALCAILNTCFPDWLTVLFFVAEAILFTYFIYFGIALQRRERLLGDIYSDPEAHSLRWIWTTIGLFVGWWIVSGLFQLLPALHPWYNVATFAYMTVLLLFVFAKVSNYKQPVSLATQQEMEDDENADVNVNVDQVVRLRELLEQEQLYLNPDLTVEDVVKHLGTNTKYFSTMLHKQMNTSFSRLVNEYRVERAKSILAHTDTKVEFIHERCGFNSRQSFHRVFVKLTGQTPSEWREKKD